MIAHFTCYLNTVCEHLGGNTTKCGIQHKLKFADKSIETTKFGQIFMLTAKAYHKLLRKTSITSVQG